MSWQQTYKARLTGADAAMAVVEAGHHVYLGGNAATPLALAQALKRRSMNLFDGKAPAITVAHVLLLAPDPLEEAIAQGAIRHHGFFVGSADRRAVNEGRADYVPVHLHQIPRLFKERLFPLDVALLSVSPPDEHGYMSLGVEVLASKAAAKGARHVICQVNEAMPRVLGDSFIHVSQATAIVEATHPLPELQPKAPSDIEETIAKHIAALVPEGATLQLGIGGIPDAVIARLGSHCDLGIHTEMMSDGVMAAIEAGVVTNQGKSLYPGKAVITFALGTRELYDYIDNNPVIEAHPSDLVNDPFVIARNDKMIAINSALAVDLSGQVCADSIGPRIFSGFGGQLDFIRGAAASKGGIPIVAFPSTAKGGAVSRITLDLLPGSGVVTTRADVHTVVTEYGVAKLWGATLGERAQRLIDIAHPMFRDDLQEAARSRRLI